MMLKNSCNLLNIGTMKKSFTCTKYQMMNAYKENTRYLFVIYEWCSAHGLLCLHGLTLRILKKKIVGQIFKRSYCVKVK